MRKAIRDFLNKRGYEIVKQPYFPAYPSEQHGADLHFRTPIGHYVLPLDAEKDGVAKAMLQGRVFDPEIVEMAKSYIRPGSAALDVGSNFGQMALLFSDYVGPTGKVYAFEAQDTVYEYLKKNIAANKKENIVALDNAVYNENGKVLIFPPPVYDAGINPYSSNAINPRLQEGRKVTTFTIDSLNIPEPVTFMKVDIQGSDLFAMQGARETIAKNRMPILFEFEQQFQEQFETSFQDYVDFTAEIGYRFETVLNDINYLIVPR